MNLMTVFLTNLAEELHYPHLECHRPLPHQRYSRHIWQVEEQWEGWPKADVSWGLAEMVTFSEFLRRNWLKKISHTPLYADEAFQARFQQAECGNTSEVHQQPSSIVGKIGASKHNSWIIQSKQTLLICGPGINMCRWKENVANVHQRWERNMTNNWGKREKLKTATDRRKNQGFGDLN